MGTGGRVAAIIDSARFTSMFGRHYREVLAYCARRSARSEAEDTTAEVFAVALRRIHEIDEETVRPWLYGVARGVMNNRLRLLQRRVGSQRRLPQWLPHECESRRGRHPPSPGRRGSWRVETP